MDTNIFLTCTVLLRSTPIFETIVILLSLLLLLLLVKQLLAPEPREIVQEGRLINQSTQTGSIVLLPANTLLDEKKKPKTGASTITLKTQKNDTLRGPIRPRLSLVTKKRKIPERDMMKSTFTLSEGEMEQTKKDHNANETTHSKKI